jgi:hypothetical protein
MVERSRILPSFPEREIEISDGGSVDFELHIVPRGTRAILAGELGDLVVSPVADVISSPVAEINPPDECDVTLWEGPVANDHELLVV